MAAAGVQYFTASTFEITPSGGPAAGYQLFFYATGTSTPQAVYSDPGLTVPILQPIVADANGRFGAIWLSPANGYKVQLFTAATPDNPTGSQVWSEDPIGPAAGGAIASNAGMIAEVRQFAGPAGSVPSGWLLCYGQAVSRTTYASLFAVIGTSWGAGDGSTTFNVPDLRGRVIAGIDNMGGSAANRITSGVSGISGVTLGASGGSQLAQRDTLTANSTSTSVVTDPQHSHVIGGNGALKGTSATGFLWGTGGGGYVFGQNTNAASTGVTVATTTTTTVTSSLTGTSQNVQPTAMMNSIIYAGA